MERGFAGQDFEDRDSQAVDISPRAQRFFFDGFRSNIRAGPLYCFWFSEQFSQSFGDGNCQAEVDDFDFGTLADQNIFRLDIFMNPAFFVHVSQCHCRRFDQLAEPRLNALAIRCNLRSQIRCAEVIHQQVDVFFVFDKLMQMDEIGMIEYRCHLCFQFHGRNDFRIFHGFGKQTFHDESVGAPLFFHFPDLGRGPIHDEIHQLVFINNIICFCSFCFSHCATSCCYVIRRRFVRHHCSQRQ